MSEIKKIAVMTGGGDCPGLNPVIRAVTKTAIMKYRLEVVGIKHGYRGLYLGEEEFINLDIEAVDEIIAKGGTILYSSNKDNLFDYTYEDENGNTCHGDVSHVGVENLEKNGIDALVVIGGDGTLTSGRDFSRKGVKVIGVPKTIDNDLAATDTTFGFDTAVSTAVEAIDRLRTTAESHGRIIVVEAMGRYAGFLALSMGVGGAADAILIPEIEYDIQKVADKLNENFARGKNYAIVVVAEGAKPLGGEHVVDDVREDSPDPIRLGGIAKVVAKQLEALTGHEARATVLGHIQRGGTPTANDRILSTRYGSYAVELLMQGKFGNMVTLDGRNMSYESLENVIGANKAVDPNGELVTIAEATGVSFGR
ncbi:MAG: ATP-dependent 6-phosphofructokinase [Ruminococcaceae bacterium]|nr:ATP-dependent 6-phosphofructokinase [Oscillospiraceae bacterium]